MQKSSVSSYKTSPFLNLNVINDKCNAAVHELTDIENFDFL